MRRLWVLGVCVFLLTGAFAGPQVTGSGVIQPLQEVMVSAGVPGQVIELAVAEGDEVAARAILGRLDGAFLEAQMDQARAAVAAAEAHLAEVKAGARPPSIAMAEAGVEYALAQVGIAEAAVAEARANLQAARAAARAAQAKFDRVADGPTALDEALANQRIALARAQLWAAQTRRDVTQAGVGMPLAIPLTFGGKDFGQLVIPNPMGPSGADVAAAEAMVVQAEAAVRVAELQLDRLNQGTRAEELAVLQAQVTQAQIGVQIAQAALDQAQQSVAVARAQVQEAEAKLALVQAGPRSGEVAVAEAQVAQARTALARLEAQREKLVLRSPMAGIVTERLVHQGENVVAGARLFSISALDPVVLMIYVPEAQLGQVYLGQKAMVQVDALPGQSFPGEVVYIASQAEFTPRSVQTQTERATIVFAVRIRIPNPDLLLKPGMPALATLR